MAPGPDDRGEGTPGRRRLRAVVGQGRGHTRATAGDVLERMLTIRLHLDDCDAGNGPLRVMPGSHELGGIDPTAIPAVRQRTPEVACTIVPAARCSCGHCCFTRHPPQRPGIAA